MICFYSATSNLRLNPLFCLLCLCTGPRSGEYGFSCACRSRQFPSIRSTNCTMLWWTSSIYHCRRGALPLRSLKLPRNIFRSCSCLSSSPLNMWLGVVVSPFGDVRRCIHSREGAATSRKWEMYPCCSSFVFPKHHTLFTVSSLFTRIKPTRETTVSWLLFGFSTFSSAPVFRHESLYVARSTLPGYSATDLWPIHH